MPSDDRDPPKRNPSKSKLGENLPGFVSAQLDFAAHIRNPEVNPPPVGIEPRRLKIYQDLVYNNIEDFVGSAFPVAKQIINATQGETKWHELVRDFVADHGSESPYFLDISQEFLAYVETTRVADLPDFLLELCHYEWVELALTVSEAQLPETAYRYSDYQHTAGLPDHIVVSPLSWPLVYRYPVHEIGPNHVTSGPSVQPTHLVVYRNREDKIKFMATNSVTHRLLALCTQAIEPGRLLEQIAEEVPEVDSQVIHETGIATLANLLQSEIVVPNPG